MDLLASLKLWHLLIVLAGFVGTVVGGWRLIQWRVGHLEKTSNGHTEDIDCIESELADINVRLARIETKLDEIKEIIK